MLQKGGFWKVSMGAVLGRDLLEFLFEAAHIQRWNDHIRPQGFTELDKQAHKMMILYVLARYEEQDRGVVLDWQALVEGGIFDLLQRIVLTDIKPGIFHELMRSRGPELNAWVFEELERRVPSLPEDFVQRMQAYLATPGRTREQRLLKAAHFLATQWEFHVIYSMNKGLYGIEETRQSIENEVEEYYDLAGVQKVTLGGKTSNFIDLIGRLRFEKRWSQCPRVPETSVMGHVLLVAVMGYFCALSCNVCKKRLINAFLGGLWHDLPEVLTRDIISPVKRSVAGLDDLIKEIEARQMAERILPLLPLSWHREIRYFTENEFANRIIEGGNVRSYGTEELPAACDKDEYEPVDGVMLKGCDHLSAFMEAYLSIEYGVSSKQLREAVGEIREKYQGKVINGIDFEAIFEQFG